MVSGRKPCTVRRDPLNLQDVEKAVIILTNDNLELACQVVEKTASDKAIREVDERLQAAYQVCLRAQWPCSPTCGDRLSLIEDMQKQTQLLQTGSTLPVPNSDVGNECSALLYGAKLLNARVLPLTSSVV